MVCSHGSNMQCANCAHLRPNALADGQRIGPIVGEIGAPPKSPDVSAHLDLIGDELTKLVHRVGVLEGQVAALVKDRVALSNGDTDNPAGDGPA